VGPPGPCLCFFCRPRQVTADFLARPSLYRSPRRTRGRRGLASSSPPAKSASPRERPPFSDPPPRRVIRPFSRSSPGIRLALCRLLGGAPHRVGSENDRQTRPCPCPVARFFFTSRGSPASVHLEETGRPGRRRPWHKDEVDVPKYSSPVTCVRARQTRQPPTDALASSSSTSLRRSAARRWIWRELSRPAAYVVLNRPRHPDPPRIAERRNAAPHPARREST